MSTYIHIYDYLENGKLATENNNVNPQNESQKMNINELNNQKFRVEDENSLYHKQFKV